MRAEETSDKSKSFCGVAVASGTSRGSVFGSAQRKQLPLTKLNYLSTSHIQPIFPLCLQ